MSEANYHATYQCQTHKMVKHTQNLSATAGKLFDCVEPFCGVGTLNG